MVEIRPMGEDYILPRCLHDGPIDAAITQACETADLHLPPHPWSDETIRDLVAENPDFGLCDAGEGFPAEFMREMIQRYGTCALLAWEEQKVVGFIRFYPMEVARPVGERARGQVEPILDPTLACGPAQDDAALWVHCVMTCPPYTGLVENPPPEVKADPNFRSAHDVGGRKGIGLRLAKALVPWARERGWKRIIKVAPCDLDVFYGIWGGGGRAFWEKAGFTSIGTIHKPQDWSGEILDILRAQMSEKGMSESDVWTFHRMVCDL